MCFESWQCLNIVLTCVIVGAKIHDTRNRETGTQYPMNVYIRYPVTVSRKYKIIGHQAVVGVQRLRLLMIILNKHLLTHYSMNST